jgi:hypothetical protein
MFWFMYYTIYVEDFLEQVSVMLRGGSVHTTLVKCDCRSLDCVASSPVTASGSSKPNFKCVKNKGYPRLYQLLEMLSIKVYIYELLKF